MASGALRKLRVACPHRGPPHRPVDESHWSPSWRNTARVARNTGCILRFATEQRRRQLGATGRLVNPGWRATSLSAQGSVSWPVVSASPDRADSRADLPETSSVLTFYYRPLGGESGVGKELVA